MKRTGPKAAIFLDRDGTIIEDRGYLTKKEQVCFYPQSFTALKKLQKHFLLFILTNQGGVSQGLQSRSQVDALNEYVVEELAHRGIHITATYCCYHQRSDNCACIKPKNFFPLKAALDYDISLEHSWTMGDHYHDVELGISMGGRGLYVLTGHGEKHKHSLPEDLPHLKDIAEAADYILSNRSAIPSNYLTMKEAAQRLKNGEVVAIPTETVYGLAGAALNEQALLKIFEAKNRPHFDPLILHGSCISDIESLVEYFPEKALQLAERFWPGPLTLVLPRSEIVPDLVTAGLETVAVRIPSHPMAQRIIEMAGTALAAPSANPFGAISPTHASHVQRQLGERIDGIVDGGASSVGIESTIVGYWKGEFQLLRPGGIPQEDIEEVVGPLKSFRTQEGSIPAPGTMKRHYSPKTPMVLQPPGMSAPQKGKIGRLTFGETKYEDCPIQLNLSPRGHLEEAAIHLYDFMRKLDGMGLDLIVADELPKDGLGRGINDRLQRAATKE
jgi:L-threonylcarbamoyladenylate synthase